MSESELPRRSAEPRSAANDEREVAPETVAIIERLVDDVARQPAPELVQRLEALIELLIQRGHLTRGHARLLRRLKGQESPSKVRLSLFTEKRSVPSTERDCPALLPLCKGRCCAMQVSLSEEDLREHRLAWDLQEPYALRRDPDHGYCSYLGDGGRCTVYDDRPATCRAYDCQNDPRVWLDWEHKVPAPLPWNLVPEAWMPDGDPAGGEGGGGETVGP